MKKQHPNLLWRSLEREAKSQAKRRNLALLNSICEAQSKSGKDLSRSTIGRLCEAAGGISRRALYNAASSDYLRLIDEWKAFVGVSQSAATIRIGLDEVASKIDDPVLRSLFQCAVAERDRLKAELNALRAVTSFDVDLRPAVQAPPAVGDPVRPTGRGDSRLTNSEISALRQAISAKLLEAEGWIEGRYGEITTERGRVIFDVGFARAIRRIIKSHNTDT